MPCLFATSALAAGLPIHILAKLLGHQNIVTTQGYAAIHDDETFRHFRRGWFGELEGIEISVNAARDKLIQMGTQVSLGIPAFPSL